MEAFEGGLVIQICHIRGTEYTPTMEPNIIRAIIFLVAGLVAILFPDKILKLQISLLKRFNIKQRDTKKSIRILGVCFLVIALVLFLY